MAKELVCTLAITVSRSAWPPNVAGKPPLVVFLYGSSVAYAAVVYVVYKVFWDTYNIKLQTLLIGWLMA